MFRKAARSGCLRSSRFTTGDTAVPKDVTIERRARKGRKGIQYFSAAFAAFAFQRGAGYADVPLMVES
jgi:hypothetical protein